MKPDRDLDIIIVLGWFFFLSLTQSILFPRAWLNNEFKLLKNKRIHYMNGVLMLISGILYMYLLSSFINDCDPKVILVLNMQGFKFGKLYPHNAFSRELLFIQLPFRTWIYIHNYDTKSNGLFDLKLSYSCNISLL